MAETSKDIKKYRDRDISETDSIEGISQVHAKHGK